MTLEPGPDGLVRDMRSSWEIEGRDAEVDLRARDAAAGGHGRADRLLDRRGLVRLRLVHRRRQRPRRSRGAARQDRLRRADCRRARRHRDGPRVPRAARRRRAGVRHGNGARRPAAGVAAGLLRRRRLRSGPCAARCCSAAAAGGRTRRSSPPAASCSPAQPLLLHGAGASCSTSRRSRSRSSRRSSRRRSASLDEQTWRAVAFALGIKRQRRAAAQRRRRVDRLPSSASTRKERSAPRIPRRRVSSAASTRRCSARSSRSSCPGFTSDVDMGLVGSDGHAARAQPRTTADGRRLPVEITLSRVATEDGSVHRDHSRRQRAAGATARARASGDARSA